LDESVTGWMKKVGFLSRLTRTTKNVVKKKDDLLKV